MTYPARLEVAFPLGPAMQKISSTHGTVRNIVHVKQETGKMVFDAGISLTF